MHTDYISMRSSSFQAEILAEILTAAYICPTSVLSTQHTCTHPHTALNVGTRLNTVTTISATFKNLHMDHQRTDATIVIYILSQRASYVNLLRYLTIGSTAISHRDALISMTAASVHCRISVFTPHTYRLIGLRRRSQQFLVVMRHKIKRP